MPAGQPTIYREEYCELVKDYGKQGFSIAEIGLELNVCKQTIYNWMKTHEKFFDAIQEAVSFAQGWYEKEARMGLTADKFNSALWNRIVGCRFRDDYGETSTVLNTNINIDAKDLPKEKMKAIAADIAKSLQDKY